MKNRQNFLVLLIVFAVGASAVAADRKPNVIIVMPDDQGYGDLGCHGNPVLKTPNLDRLHRESVRFTDFHVAPMCTPTRGQLMTGLDALESGAMNVSSGRTLLRRKHATLADRFKRGGYATGIFGKWHLGDNYPYRPEDRGFDEAVWFPSSHINSVPDYWDNDYFDDTYVHNGTRRPYQGYTTDVFFREAREWMGKQAERGRPFFCYLPTAAAHWPHFVPGKYRDAALQRLKAALPELQPIPPGKQHALASFLAMIENIDDNLGRLESFLNEQGLRENTLLIFLTDNGSTMGPDYYNAGMRGRKVTLWEGGHRVPLFVRWPAGRLEHGRDVGELTQVQDLLPTLIDLCGLPSGGGVQFDGTSLGPLLRGERESLPDRMLVVNYSRMPFRVRRPSPDAGSRPKREGAAVLWKHWRLLEDKALYDLRNDPHQDRNVIGEHPGVVKRMREHLDAWWKEIKGDVNVPERVIVGSEAENPTLLTACEWYDVFVDQQRQVRRADRKNGVWHLEAARAGEYVIELSRYPKESGLALGQAIPATKVTDGEFVAGEALPIAQARLRIGGEEKSVKVSPGAGVATFKVRIPEGPVEMQTWFLDDQGKEITGAYYAYVRRLP